jgi:hypothetical protein
MRLGRENEVLSTVRCQAILAFVRNNFEAESPQFTGVFAIVATIGENNSGKRSKAIAL